jgi:integrase
MQRVHISPSLGARAVDEITTRHVDRLAAAMLETGLAPKTVRNVLAFLHATFEHALDRGYVGREPGAASKEARAQEEGRPKSGSAAPDRRPARCSDPRAPRGGRRAPAPTRRGRRGPAPPPPPDVLGPVMRVLILTAAITGLRQSELLGLRWRDVDWTAQRIRVRNAYDDEDDLVFAHPQKGTPLDRSKVTKRFKAACTAAGVRPIRFHDLLHTFGTRMAASGQPIRAIQEFLGHADSKTTQIYMHYAPSEHEVEMVNRAFSLEATGNKTGNKLSETAEHSETEIPANPAPED